MEMKDTNIFKNKPSIILHVSLKSPSCSKVHTLYCLIVSDSNASHSVEKFIFSFICLMVCTIKVSNSAMTK